MQEWAAFEQDNGPLLVHDRVDHISAVLTGKWPAWHQHQQSDDDILAVLKQLAKPKGP